MNSNPATPSSARTGQIILTGASRGIGAAIAHELDARGFQVVGVSRSAQVPDGLNIPMHQCDLTDEVALTRVFSDIANNGPITALINNAGLHTHSRSANLATLDYNRVMATNATAVMMACREVYPFLKTNGNGLIINMGSFFDKLGVKENLAYCASKAAVGAISRCLAVEWAKDKIQVLNLAPGYIETDLNREFLAHPSVLEALRSRIPAGGPAQPTQVARLVAALLSEDIPFLTGETIYLDGGQGMHH